MDVSPAWQIGSHLGHYVIRRALGAGGMGEVYEAEDTKLHRRVALKVVRREVATDPVRRARLEREATAAARLTHPHVVTVHSLEEHDSVLFVTMELVDGTTLAEELPARGFPLKQLITLAIELTDALAAAHAAGIVHRDLKPANVMLTRGRGVKVLDFGLSRLTLDEGGDATTALPLTADGALLGTPAYMAPEQIEGRLSDARSDIFSLGVMLFEMATGRRPFSGPTPMATLAAIAAETPPLASSLNPVIPDQLARLIDRCLSKDPASRQSAQDLEAQLAELARMLDSNSLARAASRPVDRPILGRPHVLVAIGTLVLVLAVAGIVTQWRPRSEPVVEPVTAKLRRLTADSGLSAQPALSLDGRLVAFASDRAAEGNLDIWVQQVAGGDALRLTRHDADETTPVFSPDGTQIAFRSERDGGGIYEVPTLGGEATLRARGGYSPRFSPDGRWLAYQTGIPGSMVDGHLFFGGGGLFVVPTAGGTARRLHADAASIDLGVWSPDSRHLLVRADFASGVEPSQWWVMPLDGTPKRVDAGLLQERFFVGSALPVAWLPDDRVVFTARTRDNRNTWTARLSIDEGRLAPPLQQLTFGPGIDSGGAVASAADRRLELVFASIAENIDLWTVPLSQDGLRATAPPVRLTNDVFGDAHPALTADGRTLLYASNHDTSGIWARDFASGRTTRLISLPPPAGPPTNWRNIGKPVVSHDGSRLAFWSEWSTEGGSMNATYVTELHRGSDGTLLAGELHQLPAVGPEGSNWPWSWTPDSRAVWYDTVRWPRVGPNHLYDVIRRERIGEFKHSQRDVQFLLVSPDGRWLAFQDPVSNDTGRLVLTPIVEGVPAGEEQWRPLTDSDSGVYWHAWSPNSDAIYFTSARDGNICLWVQRLAKPSMTPLGAPLAVHHAHSARLSIRAIGPNGRGLAAGLGQIVFNMSETTGNVWIAELSGLR